MSTDPFAAAFAPLDAPAEALRRPAAARPRDLAELAAALARVEALLVGAGAEGPEGAAAIERIADIAFVLHERDIEPSLCDALDDAVREIGTADALKRASARRVCEAAALLRELSHALNAMVATADVEPPPKASAPATEAGSSSSSVQTVQESRDAEAAADELAAPAGLFDAEMPQDDALALTAAAHAAALPEGTGLPPADSQDEMAEPAAAAETLPHFENAADQQTIEAFQPDEFIVGHSSAAGNLHEQNSDGSPDAAIDAGFGAEARERGALPEALLNEPAPAPAYLATDQSVDLQTAARSVADHDQAPPIREPIESEPADVVAPVAAADEALAPDGQSAGPTEVVVEPMASRPAVDPDEDPGDLFEPVADAQPESVATAPAAIATPSLHGKDGEAAHASIPRNGLPPVAAEAAAAEPVSPEAASNALRVPVVAPPDAAPRPTPSDPLAPIRALSEEELIALFS
jgi:hypothetical protein